MVDTAALHRLRAWMSAQNCTQAKLAKKLGVSPPSVHAWLEGRTRPEPHLRAAIEALTKIPADDWWSHAERAQLAKTTERFVDEGCENDTTGPAPRPSRTGTDH